jgi:hypothetical protein
VVEEDVEDEEEGVVRDGRGIHGICIGVWVDLLL